ncbi:flagellin [Sulfurimonas sp.]|uniref:flagellin N-terminal helical domain-containing protein n=1 Tax=Sulfurimonas sp. TaxID=2022749 RepID=UPI001A046537|nr:flagellin [Sulfurimonas sp.]MBE0513959.1 flagellin [Sulfurimonas sp.]
MGFRINTNVGAMNAHMYATKNNIGLDKSLTALSSGLRINKAADDAAGLAIANQLSAQSSGLGQAIRNSNDGIGLIQTADGALEETGNILKRVRTLSVQAANDTQTTDTRAYIQDEVTALIEQLDDIASRTSFNGQNLLDATGGTTGTFTFHTGAYTAETTSVTITKADSTTLGVNALNVTTQAGAETAIASADAGIVLVDTLRSTLGAAQNKLESNVRNISVTQVNVSAAESQIRDVDFAAESATFAKHNILAQSGSYAMSQANAVQQNVLRLLQ